MRRCVICFLGVTVLGLIAAYVGYVMRERDAMEKPLILYGNVDIREVDLGFRVFGKVKTLYVEEGDKIRQGMVLAELDSVPYEESLDQAKAQVALMQILHANKEQQLARREKAKLAEAVSEEDVSNALAAVQESEACLARAEAACATACTNLTDTKLIAPSDGVILSRIREPGSVLQAGEPVYTLSLDSPIWIRAYVSEVQLGRVFPGMKAKIITDTTSLPVYEGQVGFISPVAEFTPKNVETTELRTDLVYRLRIFVNQPDTGLRQGMPITVHLLEE